VTATFDAENWDTYWASGTRDLQIVLDVASQGGLVGKDRVIEIGCGLGRVTRALANHFVEVVGVDISPEMLRRARQMSEAGNVSYTLVRPGSILPVESGSADLVMAWTVFRHVSDAVFIRYAREAHRVLRPSGVLVFDSQVRERGPVVRSRSHRPFPEREYTLAELHVLCSSEGFTWAAESEHPSATPGTTTVVAAWRKPAILGGG